MAEIVIYTKPGCPYCSSAIGLLNRKGVDFTEIVASNDPQKKAEMVEKSGGRATFPQIFINGDHIGGCDDIQALERKGGLDALLAA
jgi:glutaredoxin 3